MIAYPQGLELLEESEQTLQAARVVDLSEVLLEVRNRDLTWPEEIAMTSLRTGANL